METYRSTEQKPVAKWWRWFTQCMWHGHDSVELIKEEQEARHTNFMITTYITERCAVCGSVTATESRSDFYEQIVKRRLDEKREEKNKRNSRGLQ